MVAFYRGKKEGHERYMFGVSSIEIHLEEPINMLLLFISPDKTSQIDFLSRP